MVNATAQSAPVARLALADGTIFRGEAVGATGTVTGEAVFNTGMTGYQEVLTDPSYRGQIVTMTYPEIGNYGISKEDHESGDDNGKVHLSGFVMRQCCHEPSNFRSDLSLPDFLKEQNVIGISGIDTRKLVRVLRVDGAMPSALTTDETISNDALVQMAKDAPSMAGQNLASDVGVANDTTWEENISTEAFGVGAEGDPIDAKVVVIDCGIKQNILRLLKSLGLSLTVVPASTPAADILAMNPDGIFVSNGPGDPAAVTPTIASLQELIPSGKPMFGICLGHQLISLASGAKTFKLPFGHRGANHPIKNMRTGAIEIASHNHGFAVDIDSLPECLEVTHMNLNDHTCAGVRRTDVPVFSVQYHPEACPGPTDPLYLFREFADALRQHVGS